MSSFSQGPERKSYIRKFPAFLRTPDITPDILEYGMHSRTIVAVQFRTEQRPSFRPVDILNVIDTAAEFFL